MSFQQDIEGGPRHGRGGFHSSKQQPKQRRDEDSPWERDIKANIREMQENIRKATDELDSLKRRTMSGGAHVGFQNTMDRSNDLATKTEELFKDWHVHLAGEPLERQRKKFSLDKLQKAFEDELAHLKELGRRVITVQQEAEAAKYSAAASAGRGGSGALNQRAPGGGFSVREEASAMASARDDEEDSSIGLLDDANSAHMIQEDLALRQRISQERAEGIKRIQSQVAEVNQIFHDLASIVQDQGQQFETIEDQAMASSDATKQAGQELKKTVERSRSSRERMCCMIAAALVVLLLVILPHMQMFSAHPTVHRANMNFAATADANLDSSSKWGSEVLAQGG